MYNNFYIRFNYKNIIPFNLKKNKLRVHSNIIANKKKKKQSFFFKKKVKFWYYNFNVNGLKRDNITFIKKYLNKKLSVFFISNLNMIEGKWALPKIYRKYYRKKYSFLKKKKFNLLKSTFILNNNYSNYYSDLYNFKYLKINNNEIIKNYYFYNFNNFLNLKRKNYLVFFKYLKNYKTDNLYKFYLQKYQILKDKFDNNKKQYLKKKISANYDHKGNLKLNKKKNFKQYFNAIYLKNYKNYNLLKENIKWRFYNSIYDYKISKVLRKKNNVVLKDIDKTTRKKRKIKELKFFLVKKIINIIKFIKIIKEIKKYNKKNFVYLFYKFYVYFKFIKLYEKKVKNKKFNKKKLIKNLFNSAILNTSHKHNKIFQWIKLLTLKKSKKLGSLDKYNKKNIFKWIKLLYNNIKKMNIKKKILFNIIKLKKKFIKLLTKKIYVLNKVLIHKNINFFNKSYIKYILLGQIWWQYPSSLKKKRKKKRTYRSFSKKHFKMSWNNVYETLKGYSRITDIAYKYKNFVLLSQNQFILQKAKQLYTKYNEYNQKKKKLKKIKLKYLYKTKYPFKSLFHIQYDNKYNFFTQHYIRKMNSRNFVFRNKQKQFYFLPREWMSLLIKQKKKKKFTFLF